MRCWGLLVASLPLAGCQGLLSELLGDEEACETTTPFWRDANGDGVGDAGVMYFGCEAPEGYVDVAPSAGPAPDTDPPDDSDAPDTDDSDASDSDDSDLPDTDPPDTAP